MSITRQRQLLREIVAEYDLETVLDALLAVHDRHEITTYLTTEDAINVHKG